MRLHDDAVDWRGERRFRSWRRASSTAAPAYWTADSPGTDSRFRRQLSGTSEARLGGLNLGASLVHVVRSDGPARHQQGVLGVGQLLRRRGNFAALAGWRARASSCWAS